LALDQSAGQAIVWLERARGHSPAHPGVRAGLASAYALNGETERAVAELAEARRLFGHGPVWSLSRLKARYWGVPSVNALFEASLFAGLRKAGMPEE
jgi:predicted Zn-dependent protease